MKRKRKRAVRVYESEAFVRVYGRGEPELWMKYVGTNLGRTLTTEDTCMAQRFPRLTGPALAAWLREHPKPKGK
jgi:hypothetical protein